MPLLIALCLKEGTAFGRPKAFPPSPPLRKGRRCAKTKFLRNFVFAQGLLFRKGFEKTAFNARFSSFLKIYLKSLFYNKKSAAISYSASQTTNYTIKIFFVLVKTQPKILLFKKNSYFHFFIFRRFSEKCHSPKPLPK